MKPIALLCFSLGALTLTIIAVRGETAPRVAISSQQKNNALIEAVEGGEAPYVKQLLREGADPNARLLWQRATNFAEGQRRRGRQTP